MFNFQVPSIDLVGIAPVVIVALTGLVALLIEMFRRSKDNGWLVAISLVGLTAAGAFLFNGVRDATFETASGMAIHDNLGSVIQLIIVGCTALTVLFSDRYLRQKRVPFGEFYPLVLWSATGAMLMASTTNFLMIFLGLEILSIALYVMAGMSRSEEKSEESAMKYFLLGAFAGGFLLYGIALIYGATGSLSVDSIGPAWSSSHPESRLLLSCGLGLVLVGLSFKAAFVPFHQWTPDVYQGAPTSVTAFMATVSKIAAFAALWRVLDASRSLSALWLPALGAVAILTMLVGNLLALAQTDVKRVLAYSSISHSGYLLVGVLAHAAKPMLVGTSTFCYYLLSYGLMTIGAFAIVSLFAKEGREETRYEDLSGLWQRSPVAAGLMVVFMLSLVGLPPLAGFFGKAFLFGDAVRAGLTPLAIVLAASSIISAGYYLRIAKWSLAPDEETSGSTLAPFGGTLAAASTLCGIGVLAATLFYAPLMGSLGFAQPAQSSQVAVRGPGS